MSLKMVFGNANCFLVGGVSKNHHHQEPNHQRKDKYKNQRSVRSKKDHRQLRRQSHRSSEKAALSELPAVRWEQQISPCAPRSASKSSGLVRMKGIEEE